PRAHPLSAPNPAYSGLIQLQKNAARRMRTQYEYLEKLCGSFQISGPVAAPPLPLNRGQFRPIAPREPLHVPTAVGPCLACLALFSVEELEHVPVSPGPLCETMHSAHFRSVAGLCRPSVCPDPDPGIPLYPIYVAARARG